jgi:putative solute:sodium symporter small subunit
MLPGTEPASLHRWQRVRRLTAALLVPWVCVVLGVPWFAPELSELHLLGFPLGYWMASQGALLVFLAIVAGYALSCDRLDATLAEETHADPHADPRGTQGDGHA